MDCIDLPLVPAGTSIGRALDIMGKAKRSGVVTRIAGKQTVIEASDLLADGRMRETKIGQVRPSRGTGQLPQDPLADNRATETALDGQDALFGIFEKQGRTAVVVTRHEGIAQDLRASPSYFVCKDVRRHLYSSSTVPNDRICPNDGEPIELIVVS